jgi:regulator of sirC expression with transglutaminase-like and TPR domain
VTSSHAPFDDDDDLALERVAFDTSRPEFDLLRAAALLPRIEGRAPHVEDVVDAVESWAAEVRADASRRTSWQGPLHALVTVLFARVRLRGDEEDYDAPRNSFLDDVVARRRGLPISLSLLVVETARRAGLVACGLALPRHFMAGLMLQRRPSRGPLESAEGSDLFFLDPFHAQVLPPEDVAQRVGLPLDELAEHLSPAPPEVILLRMLTNLRGSYLRRQDATSCLRTVSRLLLLKPRDGALHLERAHLRYGLGDASGALLDAQHGLQLARDPDEKEAAERILDKLSKTVGYVH